MSSNKLKLEVNDKVANLILDQPEKHNAFDDIIIKEIKDTIDNIGQNPENAIPNTILKSMWKQLRKSRKNTTKMKPNTNA